MNYLNNNRKEKGFVILIAIVISGLLVSIGMFIANVAYKELLLSTSAKASQKAFFVADSVMECAMRHDIRKAGFWVTDSDSQSRDFICNNMTFQPHATSTGGSD